MSIKEIAKRTGYSTATVSRVLNNDQTLRVSEKCRRLILEEAKQQNYQKKTQQSIESLKTKKIGIIPLGLENTGRGELQDPYYLYLKTGMEWQLDNAGIELVKTISLKSKEDYAKLEDLDGLIIIGKKVLDFNNPYLSAIEHVVIVDSDMMYPRYDAVVCDLELATNLAIETLIGAGYQTIGYIGGNDYINDFEQNILIEKADIRNLTYLENMFKRKRVVEPYLFLGNAFTAQEGHRLTKLAIETGKLPDAFLVGSDPMARGVYSALAEAGYQIGQDIGIISIDGIEDSQFMIPPLATVKIDSFEMGKVAISRLIEQMMGRKTATKTILAVELIRGASF